MADDVPHVQAKFFTKQKQYSVPDIPYSISVEVNREKLSELITGLLNENVDTDSGQNGNVLFDFLLNGELLRSTLSKYLSEREISSETVLEIEYVERQAAPKPERTLEHDDWVSAVHGAGNYILSGSYSNTVHLWAAETEGEAIMTIPGHTAPIKCVRWIEHDETHPVSSFVTGSHDQTALVWHWNRETNEVDCRLSCRGHAASVDCVAVHPSEKLMCTGSWDKMLKLWSTAYSNEDDGESEATDRPSKKKKNSSVVQTRVPMLTLSGHTEAISALTWMDKQTVVTASWDHSIRLWDMQEARQTALLPGSKAFLSISFSSLNQTLITGSADRHVRLYDPRSLDSVLVKCSFTSHSGWVTGVCWSPSREHLFLSGSYDSVLKLWDIRSPKAPLYDMSKHEDRVLTVDWSIPHLMLSGGADNNLNMFKYDAGRASVN